MNILVIGDCHFPFHDKRAFRAMFRAISEMEFTHIVQIGDLLDCYNFSDFPRSYNLMTPAEEIEDGLNCAREMWFKLKELNPKAICYQILGNHEQRILKKISKVPELESLFDVKSIFKFDGVHTMDSMRDELILKDICFMHGYYCKEGQHLAHNHMNTVIGHAHRGWVVHKKIKGNLLWELNAGCLADLDSKPLGYTAQRKLNNMQNGFGLIDDLGARFVPIVDGKLWR